MKKDFRLAFTMAEIIIAMTVIGVLAVITLPSLTSNIDDKNFATRRVALYSRLSQAVGVVDSLSDAGRYSADGSRITNTANIQANAAMAFILNKLSQGIKIENTCDSSNLKNCGMSSANNFYAKKGGTKFTLPTTFDGIHSAFKFNTPDENGVSQQQLTNVAAFTTKNGDSLAIYYNPDCLSGTNGNSYKDMVCANFFYDLNGLKGPNMMGKDVGVGTILFSTGAEVIMPTVINYSSKQATQTNAISQCAQDGYVLPSRNELISMALNENYLYTQEANNEYWSATNVMVTGNDGNLTTMGWTVSFATNSTAMGKYLTSTEKNYKCADPITK